MKILLTIIPFLCFLNFSESKLNLKFSCELKTPELSQKNDSLIIFGIIKDNIGEPFKYARVKINNSEKKIFVNEEGRYRINARNFFKNKNKFDLEFSFLGFKTIKKTIKKEFFSKKNRIEVNVQLKEGLIIINCPTGK